MLPAFIATSISYAKRLRGNTLLVNSLYLMLATVALAGFGFIFWAIVTKLYPTATVGLATTLLSLSGLISMLSLVGFDTTLVRFLPKATRKADQINSGLVIVGVASAVLSTLCVLTLPLTSPSLAFVLHDPGYFMAFVFFTVATSLNTLTNAIFLAYKQARNIFIVNMIFSLVKVALPLLVSNGSAMTIFVLAGISQVIGLVVSLVVIRATTGYTFSPRVHFDILKVIKKYSLSVYVSSILNLLPPTILPLIIIHQINPENAAYYYMAFTIASVLYTIAYASMQSAFAEGSHNESAMKAHIVKASKLVGVLLIPASLLIAGLSSFILGIFGDDYAQNGRTLLLLFAASSVFVAAYSGLGAIFKVTKHLRAVVVMNVIYTVVILGVSYFIVPHLGIVAIGWAWMFGNIAATGAGLFYLHYHK